MHPVQVGTARAVGLRPRGLWLRNVGPGLTPNAEPGIVRLELSRWFGHAAPCVRDLPVYRLGGASLRRTHAAPGPLAAIC